MTVVYLGEAFPYRAGVIYNECDLYLGQGFAEMEKGFIVAALHGDRDCANFTEAGMEGVERKKPDRPVSLMTLTARQGVDQAELRGLCYARFTADITLDCDQLPDQGTILGTEEFQLGILPGRKRCWPECELFQNKLPCPLIDGVRYAWVEVPGVLCRGDQLKIVDNRTGETPEA